MPPKKQPRMIVYGHNCCKKGMQHACDSAMKYGFESCKKFGLADLVSLPALSPQGQEILTTKERGAGQWIWKPLLIWQELLQAADGDIIVYMDADSYWEADPTPLLDLLDGQDVVGFSSRETEANATKTDVLLMLNGTQYLDTQQLYAGLILVRRSWASLGFVSQWLAYCQDKRWLTNSENTLLPSFLQGQNHPGFAIHRNDQAIFSLLYKRWGFQRFPDPSLLGDYLQDRRPYPRIWGLTARKD